jgi:hypothetical protein
MYKVVISTDSTPIEIREKIYAPVAANRSIQEVLTEAPDLILIIRVDGKDYEISQDDFNKAVTPFLYTGETE